MTTWLYWVLDIKNSTTPLTCRCSACEIDTPIGVRSGFAYECESSIVDQCVSFDCNARCNGNIQAKLPPLTIDDTPFPTKPPTSAPVDTPTTSVTPAPVSTDVQTTNSGAEDPTQVFWMFAAAIIWRMVAH